MLFENPKEASLFVESVWENIDDWWYSNEIQESLKIFNSHLAYEKKNKVKIWANLINDNF